MHQMERQHITTNTSNKERETFTRHLFSRIHKMNNTIEDVYRVDRLQQALAELSLAYIDNQFPAVINIDTDAQTFPTVILQSTANQIQNITQEHAYPSLYYVTEYLNNQGDKISSDKQVVKSGSVIDNRILVTNEISSNTTQGIVYQTVLIPNKQFQYNSPYDKQTITAVMKKSPIFNRITLFNYLSNVNIPLPDEQDYADEALDQLYKQYNDRNNAAYRDALGAVVSSRLVEYGLSCFFALCYGTMRVLDTIENPIRNRPPVTNYPVQLTFLQPLSEDVYTLARRGWFGNQSVPQCNRILSMFAQVVFGLSIAQTLIDLVHGDLHTQNVLHERVPDNTVLFYKRRSTNTYYAVPTHGRVFKAIDFGKSSFLVKNVHVSDPLMRGNKAQDLFQFISDLKRDNPWILGINPDSLTCLNVLGLINNVMKLKALPSDNIKYFDMYRIKEPPLTMHLYFLID
jgi:hypothetical protein